MLISNKRGAKSVLELYVIFIAYGSAIMISLRSFYLYLHNLHVSYDLTAILNIVSGSAVLYFIPIYYYNKFKSINIMFYINYNIVITVGYIFYSIFMRNLNNLPMDRAYMIEVLMFVTLCINMPLFMTYYAVMIYSYFRKKILSSRLVVYSKEKHEWFI